MTSFTKLLIGFGLSILGTSPLMAVDHACVLSATTVNPQQVETQYTIHFARHINTGAVTIDNISGSKQASGVFTTLGRGVADNRLGRRWELSFPDTFHEIVFTFVPPQAMAVSFLGAVEPILASTVICSLPDEPDAN